MNVRLVFRLLSNASVIKEFPSYDNQVLFIKSHFNWKL